MADQLTGVIDQLERQKIAIERALAALRNIRGYFGNGGPNFDRPREA